MAVSSKLVSFPFGVVIGGVVPTVNIRVNCPIGSGTGLNATGGVTLLPALTWCRYRLVDFTFIARGGNFATATGLYLKGTIGTSVVNLASILIAALTDDAVVKPNTANVTMLADNWFLPLDQNTPIYAIKNGSDIATATSMEAILTVAIEEGAL